MSNLCKVDRFKIYDFPPPKMFEGCVQFVMEHNDDIIETMMGRKDDKGVQNELCYNLTRACVDEEL